MLNRKESKILITGANGLLGSKLLSFLIKTGYQNVTGLFRNSPENHMLNHVIGNLTDLGSLEEALAGVKTVIHCGAIVSFDPKDKEILNTVNVEGTANLVNTCLSLGVEELVYISSVAALGKPSLGNISNEEIILNENQKWTDSPLNSNYAKSKYDGECEVWRGEAEGLKVVIVNPSVIIGEGDWDKSSSRLFKYVWDENKFVTKGYINYVDVNDVTASIEQILAENKFGERYILNAGKVSFQKFFESVALRFGKKAPSFKLSNFWIGILWRVEYFRSAITGSKPLITKETSLSASSNFYFDNKKVKKELGFKFQSLDDSLDRICDYYLTKNPL
jgi:nucleoside-diphosphate-sugar epimerase